MTIRGKFILAGILAAGTALAGVLFWPLSFRPFLEDMEILSLTFTTFGFIQPEEDPDGYSPNIASVSWEVREGMPEYDQIYAAILRRRYHRRLSSLWGNEEKELGETTLFIRGFDTTITPEQLEEDFIQTESGDYVRFTSDTLFHICGSKYIAMSDNSVYYLYGGKKAGEELVQEIYSILTEAGIKPVSVSE